MDLTLQDCLSKATGGIAVPMGMSATDDPNYLDLDRVRAVVIRHNFTSTQVIT